MPTSIDKVAVLREGVFTDMFGRANEFTRKDLREIAASYNAESASAPVTLGHGSFFTDGDPNHGVISDMNVRNGILYANFEDVPDSTADMISEGRYRKVSVSLFLRDNPANPEKGKLYLRHVALLGADSPAVPNLPDIPRQFAAPQNDTQTAMLVADKEILSKPKKERTMPTDNNDAEIAALTTENNDLKASVASLKADIEKMKADAKAKADTDAIAEDALFVASLIKDGKIQDGQKESALVLLSNARAQGEAQYKAQCDFLSAQTPAIENDDKPSTSPTAKQKGDYEPTGAEISAYAAQHKITDNMELAKVPAILKAQHANKGE